MMRTFVIGALLALGGAGLAQAGELRPLSAQKLCLSLEDSTGAKPDGVPLVLKPCNGGPEQQFRKGLQDTLGVEERCVQMAGQPKAGQSTGGPPLVVGTCTGAFGQRWGISLDGRFVGQNFQCVQVQGKGQAGDAVAMADCRKRPDEVANQRWAVYGKL